MNEPNPRARWYWCVPDRVAAAWGAPIEGKYTSHTESLFGLSDIQFLRCVTRMCERDPRRFLGAGREAERISNPSTLTALAELTGGHPCASRMLLLSHHLPDDAFTSGDYLPAGSPWRAKDLVDHLLEAGIEPCLASTAFTTYVIQEWARLSRLQRHRLLSTACHVLEYGAANLSHWNPARHALQLRTYENVGRVLKGGASTAPSRRRVQALLADGILPSLTTSGLIVEDVRLHLIATTLAEGRGRYLRNQSLPQVLYKYLPGSFKTKCSESTSTTWHETNLSDRAGIDAEADKARREDAEGWRELLLHSQDPIPAHIREEPTLGSDIFTPLIVSCLEPRFGDDVLAWNIASELMPTWQGTFTELTDTALAVAQV